MYLISGSVDKVFERLQKVQQDSNRSARDVSEEVEMLKRRHAVSSSGCMSLRGILVLDTFRRDFPFCR